MVVSAVLPVIGRLRHRIRCARAEELEGKLLVVFLDDDRLRPNLRDLPVGKFLAILEAQNFVRLVQANERRLAGIGNDDAEEREVAGARLWLLGLVLRLAFRACRGGPWGGPPGCKGALDA